MDKRKWIKLIIFIFGLLVSIGITIACFGMVMGLLQPENQEQFRSWLSQFGVGGWFILLFIQIGQVVIAFIPGEPIEIIAGAMYGTWGGLLLCMLGTLLGTILIFTLVQKLGKPFLCLFIPEESLQKYDFLHNTKKLKMVVFVLFLIPGTPKDALTYAAGLTPISIWSFIGISTFARIPSIISSNLLGESLMVGKLWVTILVFAGCIGIGLFGIWLNNKIIAPRIEKKRDEKRKGEIR